MAQPTTALLEPDDDRPKACNAGYAWCNGECQEDQRGDDDWQGDDWAPVAYHCGAVAHLAMQRFTFGGWQDLGDVALIVRHDENEGDDSQPLILIDYPVRECTPGMTAQQARQNAAWLMNAADMLDPLPIGVMLSLPELLHLGDELLTDDGWQKVTGLMVFAGSSTVGVYTPERNEEDSDGWQLDPEDLVQIRRCVHGSCAVHFVEPVA